MKFWTAVAFLAFCAFFTGLIVTVIIGYISDMRYLRSLRDATEKEKPCS